MNSTNNQNFVFLRKGKYDLEELKKLILGYCNTFGGYLIFDENTQILTDLKSWCKTKNIKFKFDECLNDGQNYFYFKLPLILELIKSDKNEYFFKIKDKLVKQKGNLIGINYDIYTSIRTTDLLRINPTVEIEDVLNHLNKQKILNQWYFIDLEYRTAFITFFHTLNIEDRHNSSKLIISKIWKRHKKELLIDFLDYLDSFEKGAHFFYKSHRDHVVHRAYVYFLGIYLCKLIDKLDWVDYNNRFIWRFASTFHDIAYPFQLASNTLNLILEKVKSEHDNLPIISSSFNEQFLNNNLNSIDAKIKNLITDHISYDIFEILKEDLHKGTEWCKNISFFDHGILSGFIMIKFFDKWNKENDGIEGYEKLDMKDLAEAVVAIMVHNKRWSDKEKEKRVSKDKKISFLLILADMIQEWDRYSPSGICLPPSGIKLNYDNSKKTLFIYLLHDSEKINKLNKELNEKLVFDDNLKVEFKTFQREISVENITK